jgi:hypothetical protein
MFLFLASFSSLNLHVKTGAYPGRESLHGASLGLALVSVIDVRPGWKGLPGTNSVPYLASSSVMKKVIFITLAAVTNVVKLFYFSL